ncbi:MULTISPECIES: M20/M25/M40 family metallo-hydrolase [unclassified Pseudactinotalea]|uniref:M20/M25/M40 family metallo-hydrolase n=1 Tax=unclassified Pseudactinotalea TaxID=2649176 RepID=UPI00128C7764|nr:MULTISPECIES: M20/M25/M40 family metallo-hydrolase [unclassified Pseudactinotalea]MPV49892.1 M20/M25/M40 family metallo-hydrolase [Pseudactinotalea sp. HY160]QGH69155.1 M20/M25/M40 family metallo-hydrolase [Pseudactinotalea sp. HY158]
MSASTTRADQLRRAELDAVRMCRELIRIDSTNPGDNTGPGERAAAEYVMEQLTDVGYDPVYLESDDRRGNVILRIPGTDSARDALVVHGHTDVVPADASEWKMDPFGGEEMDGMIWGRGAVDMKNMDAMILAVVRDMKRSDWRPRRDLVVAFFADEEAGGTYGARWLVDRHADLFAGATEAISEVGGYSVEVDGRRVYLLQTAEKGLAWLRLLARGTAGHGSQINTDNAVTELAGAIARIGAHRFETALHPTVRDLLAGVADLTGRPFDPADPATIDDLVAALGPASKFVGATLRTNANPTRLDAGYKANVIPGGASAAVDLRFLPGEEEAAMATIAELAGENITIEDIHRDIALEAPFSGGLVDRMIGSLDAEDPGALVLPYMLSGGTDNKSLARLGITGYGFAPLRLTPDLDFAGMFHGVDERVPVDAIEFGVRVLARFLADA